MGFFPSLIFARSGLWCLFWLVFSSNVNNDFPVTSVTKQCVLPKGSVDWVEASC